MGIDLSINGGVIFGSRSRVNTDSRDFGTFAASSMQNILERIIDGDPKSYWHSQVASDAQTETIQMSFHIFSALTSQSIDIIALQNINLKNYVIEHSNDGGASFAIVPGFDHRISVGVDGDNINTDPMKTFSPITVNFLRLTAFTTIDANKVKKIGGLFAIASTLQLVIGGMVKYERDDRETIRSLKLGSGARSDELIQRSAKSHEHFGASVQFDLVSQAEHDTMRDIKRTGTPFVFIPQPFEISRDIFTCLFKSRWKARHMTSYTGAGYRIPQALEETGQH